MNTLPVEYNIPPAAMAGGSLSNGELSPDQCIRFFEAVTGAQLDEYIGYAINTEYFNRNHIKLFQLKEMLNANPQMLKSNSHFCCSVLDAMGQTAANTVKTKSIIFDIDYGVEGHRKPSVFADEKEALDHVLDLPITPQVIWHTGHGLQAAYILDTPILFANTKQTSEYEKIKKEIYRQAKADHTSSRAQLFRFPCSVNIKPSCEPVRGRVLRDEFHIFS